MPLSIDDELTEKIAERVRLAMRGMSYQEVARRAGLNQQTVERIAKGKSSPMAINLVKIAQALGIDGHWLLTGQRLIDDTRAMGTAEALAVYAEKRLPLWGQVDCASFKWPSRTKGRQRYVLVPPELEGPNRYVLRARGDCMAKAIMPNDLCVFDPDLKVEDGMIVVAELSGDQPRCMIKRYFHHGNCVELRPENLDKYGPIILTRSRGGYVYKGHKNMRLSIAGVMAGLIRYYTK